MFVLAVVGYLLGFYSRLWVFLYLSRISFAYDSSSGLYHVFSDDGYPNHFTKNFRGFRAFFGLCPTIASISYSSSPSIISSGGSE